MLYAVGFFMNDSFLTHSQYIHKKSMKKIKNYLLVNN